MTKIRFLLIAIVFFACTPPFQCFAWQESPATPTLITQINDKDAEKRRETAEALADIVDHSRIVPPLLERLKLETDQSVKLAIHYAIACQGEKTHVKPLIESRNRSGHFGYIYLRHASGRDFGWQIGEYKEWYEKTTEKEYRDFINERLRRKPMMEEYAEFTNLYWKQTMGSMRLVETGELVNPDDQLTGADKIRLEELPTAKSWDVFTDALQALDENGDRKQAAKLFHRIVNEYPDTYYADQARELSELLDKMIFEDSEFKMPANFEKLELRKQIAVHLHFLRDARGYQFSQPGSCQLSFHGSTDPAAENYNPALALFEIGEPAADVLADHLDDRRPVRGVGYWRNFRPSRSVLRYSDAAEQIIGKIN